MNATPTPPTAADGVPLSVIALAVVLSALFFGSLLLWQHFDRKRNPHLAPAGGMPPIEKKQRQQSIPSHPEPAAQVAPFVVQQPASAPESAPLQLLPPIKRAPWGLDRHPVEREHTCMAGKTGSRKTTTTYTILVNDIAHGAHCIVCSTHYTPYHPEDQLIDLRPIEHLFEVAFTHETIAQVLEEAIDRIGKRMHLYRQGLNVGQPIVLYLGEWGSIQTALGKKRADEILETLLDQGRKAKVLLVVELHSALVGRHGGDSAIREAYKTRLAHTVDKTTWSVFVGSDVPHVSPKLGEWMTSDGIVAFERPTLTHIEALARTMACQIVDPIFKAQPASRTSPDVLLEALLAEETAVPVPTGLVLESADEATQEAAGQQSEDTGTDEEVDEMTRIVVALLRGGLSGNAIIKSVKWPDRMRARDAQLAIIRQARELIKTNP